MSASVPASLSLTLQSSKTSCSGSQLRLPPPLSTKCFFSGAHGRRWEMAILVQQHRKLTQYLLGVNRSQGGSQSTPTFHRIARLVYQPVDLHVLFFSHLCILFLMNLCAIKDVSMTIEGAVGEWNSKVLISKFNSLFCLNTNSLQIILTFT